MRARLSSFALALALVCGQGPPSAKVPAEQSFREQSELILKDGAKLRMTHVVRWQEVPGHALGDAGWTNGGTRRHDLYLVDAGKGGRWSIIVTESKDAFAEKVPYTSITSPDAVPLGSPSETTVVKEQTCGETFTTCEIAELESGEKLLVKETEKAPPCSERSYFLAAGGALHKLTADELSGKEESYEGAVPRSFLRQKCSERFQRGLAFLMSLGFGPLHRFLLTGEPELAVQDVRCVPYDRDFDARFGWPCAEDESKENCLLERAGKACELCKPSGWFMQAGDSLAPVRWAPASPSQPEGQVPPAGSPAGQVPPAGSPAGQVTPGASQAGSRPPEQRAQPRPEGAPQKVPARGTAVSIPAMAWESYEAASLDQILRESPAVKGVQYCDEKYQFTAVAAKAPQPCSGCAEALAGLGMFSQPGPMRIARALLVRSAEGRTVLMYVPEAIAAELSRSAAPGRGLKIWAWHLYYDGAKKEHGFVVTAFEPQR